MPNFKRQHWGEYIIKASPSETDWVRNMTPIHLIPYFWDSEIAFDLAIQPPKDKRGVNENWEY